MKVQNSYPSVSACQHSKGLSLQRRPKQETLTGVCQGIHRAKTLTKNLNCGGAPQDFVSPDCKAARELLAVIMDVDRREVESTVYI
jgi:hypothetical protein